jgi:hypothetical protein
MATRWCGNQADNNTVPDGVKARLAALHRIDQLQFHHNNLLSNRWFPTAAQPCLKEQDMSDPSLVDIHTYEVQCNIGAASGGGSFMILLHYTPEYVMPEH